MEMHNILKFRKNYYLLSQINQYNLKYFDYSENSHLFLSSSSFLLDINVDKPSPVSKLNGLP